MKTFVLLVLTCLPCCAIKIGITQIAAGTTIGINLLEARSTIKKVKTAGSKVKQVTVKAVKKVVKK